MMADNDNIIDDLLTDKGATLNSRSKKDLKNAGIWGIFLSIFGFIFAGVIIFAGISVLMIYNQTFSGSNDGFNELGFNVIGYIMIAIGLLMFIPAIYLIRFSIHAVKAESNTGALFLEKSVSSLKYFFMTYTIVILLSFLLYTSWAIYIGMSANRF